MRRFALFVLIALASASPAAAASWWELNFGLSGPRYDAIVPVCEDPGVLRYIYSKFSHNENSNWNSNLEIVGIDRIREIAWRPWDAQTIPRRFCMGVAHISDGSHREISYSINETGGWVGVGYGVEWCVRGLDREWAYHPACQMAQP